MCILKHEYSPHLQGYEERLQETWNVRQLARRQSATYPQAKVDECAVLINESWLSLSYACFFLQSVVRAVQIMTGNMM